MDASGDSMHATYVFLKYGSVNGSRVLPFEQVVELLGERVTAALPYLRELTLPTIGAQVLFSNKLPEDFRERRAVKVYAVGEEAWGDDQELTQYWFVDRDGRWYWVKFDRQGGSLDIATVTANHLIQAHRVPASPELARINCLSVVSEAFRRRFAEAAERAHVREMKLRKGATEQAALGADVGRVID